MKQDVNYFFADEIGMSNKPTQNGKDSLEELRIRFYHQRTREFGRRFDGFEALATETLLDLIFTYDVAATRCAALLHRHKLSLSAFNVLMILRLAPERDYKMHEIGKLLVVSRANVTFLIDTLTRKHLVERAHHQTDKRARLIRITPAGEKLLDAIMPDRIQEDKKIMSALSDEEKQIFRRLLARIRESAEIN